MLFCESFGKPISSKHKTVNLSLSSSWMDGYHLACQLDFPNLSFVRSLGLNMCTKLTPFQNNDYQRHYTSQRKLQRWQDSAVDLHHLPQAV